MKISYSHPFCLTFFLFVGLIFGATAQTSSNFSVDADGWSIADLALGTTPAATYDNTGGNPGGDISYSLNSPYYNVYFAAPSKYIGNISTSYNKTLTFDMYTSVPGTDNSQGDIIISGTNNLQYQLPVKPAPGVWTSYSIPLNESSWHLGCPTCPAPTQAQMKQTLLNVASIKIRLKYATGLVTTALDNVVLNKQAATNPPVISSFTPISALPGATVTIAGNNFNTTVSQNSVFFRGVKATITNATSTQLTVTVPKSAAFGPITVEDNATGLQGSSVQSFSLLFDNNKDFAGRIIPASMARGYYTTLPSNPTMANSFGALDKGDLDGDGWVDLVATETQDLKILVYRNSGAGGSVSSSSFDPQITLPSLSGIPGGGPNLSEIIVVDIDSDGKLDIVASTAGNTSSELAVYRNVSTPGNISFNSPLFFAYPYYNPLYIAAGDLDGDGRVDFAAASGTSPSNVYITQNLSTPGNIDFSYGTLINPANTSGYSDIVIGDLNGDGKPEVICPGYNATNISIYENASTVGMIAMNPAFTIPQQVSYTTQIAVADLDADSKLDLAWSTYGAQFIYLAKNLSTGGTLSAASFGGTIQIPNKLPNPSGINVGDINADGKPDIVLSAYSDVGIMQNVGATGALGVTSFTSPVLFQVSPTGAALYLAAPAIADLDGDNKPEISVVYTNNAGGAAEKAVFILHNESFPTPVITSVTPDPGSVGNGVDLMGNSLATGSGAPAIRLNKISSPVGAVTNTVTTTTDPLGGSSGRFSLTDHGLTAFSSYFLSLFPTSGNISATSFGGAVDFAIANNPRDALDVADFDDDGKLDVAIIENGFTGRVFQNTTATGSNITTSSLNLLATTMSSTYDLIALDADGDGRVDLQTGTNLVQNTSNGSITFAPGVSAYPMSYSAIAAADFNKDGKTDVAAITGTSFVQVYENLTSRGTFVNSGSFQSFSSTSTNLAKPSAAGGVVAADFDGDGFDDIAATNNTTNNFTFYKNQAVSATIGASSFSAGTNVATGAQPFGLAAIDLDGDNKVDIAVTHNNQLYVAVYLNTSTAGAISFGPPTNLPCLTKGYKIAAQDLDGDGRAELVVIHQPNPGPGSFSIFKNNSSTGAVNFGAAINTALTRNPQAVAIADMNDDQKPDILIVGSGGASAPASALSVFQNNLAVAMINIVLEPAAGYSVCSGAMSVLTTSATGTTNIMYQWQKLDIPSSTYMDLTNSAGYSNVTTSSMTINTTGGFGTGTYRCKISGDFAATVYTTTVAFTVNAVPAGPLAQSVSNCGPGSVELTASGASDGQYQWYDQNGAISDQVDATYETPTLTTTTAYGVTITNGTCVSTKTVVSAVINVIPNAPTGNNATACTASSVQLIATGGTNGEYRWYNVSSGGTAVEGQNNGTFETPIITESTSYYVSIVVNSCESQRTQIPITFGGAGCADNLPPVVDAPTETVSIGGIDTLDIAQFISDPNNNLDLSTLKVISQPVSGAKAAINSDHRLVINYIGVAFIKADSLEIRVCDLLNACTEQTITLDLIEGLIIYAGVSPNGDNANEVLEMQGIDAYPDNQVNIYNRWGDEVFKVTAYNNTTHAFSGFSTDGTVLPAGIYFYKVSLGTGAKPLTGYLDLKR